MGANAGVTTWETPLILRAFYVIEYRLRFDAAASPANALLPRFFTEADDALSRPWPAADGPYWCNPPYARGTLARWAAHIAAQVEAGATVVALVPGWTESPWFTDCLLPLASELHYLAARVPFLLGGQVCDSGRFPSLALVLHPASERHPLAVKVLHWKNEDTLRLVPISPGWPVVERDAYELMCAYEALLTEEAKTC